MGNISGTPRKVVINGVTYDVFADTNINLIPSKYEIEGLPTSGVTMYKMTKRVETAESLTLKTNPAEKEELKSVAESLADATLAIELADGSTFKASGKINYESFESEENKSTVQLIPSDGWTPFLAD